MSHFLLFPILNSELIALECSQNLFKVVPLLNPSLKYFICENSKLETIRNIPDSLIVLLIRNNLINNLPYIPYKLVNQNILDSDSVYIKLLYNSDVIYSWEGNPIKCITNYTEGMPLKYKNFHICS